MVFNRSEYIYNVVSVEKKTSSTAYNAYCHAYVGIVQLFSRRISAVVLLLLSVFSSGLDRPSTHMQERKT